MCCHCLLGQSLPLSPLTQTAHLPDFWSRNLSTSAMLKVYSLIHSLIHSFRIPVRSPQVSGPLEVWAGISGLEQLNSALYIGKARQTFVGQWNEPLKSLPAMTFLDIVGLFVVLCCDGFNASWAEMSAFTFCSNSNLYKKMYTLQRCKFHRLHKLFSSSELRDLVCIKGDNSLSSVRSEMK